MIALLLMLTLSLQAATDSVDAFEKSYPRDNTFCNLKEKRLEILIRGSSKFIESKDRGYGELIFYRTKNGKPILLESGRLEGETFRLFTGVSPHCSKSHGYIIDPKTLAILLLKENRPFKDKLVMQLFDIETMSPKQYIETQHTVDKAAKTENGFSIRTFYENHDRDVGKVVIEGQSYIYHEKEFPKWMKFHSNTFETSTEITFSKLPWKKAFQGQEDFNAVSGWDPAQKKFSKEIVYLAVNYQIKKRCYLFVENKQKLTGNELWRCQTI
jgi:hypothetical protein